MKYFCPICEKAGLPDYKNTPTVCPQCNSDLKPFSLIHSIAKPKLSKRIWFSLIVLVTIVCVLGMLYINSLNYNNKIVIDNAKIEFQLKDSINNLHTIIKKEKNVEIGSDENEIIIHYKVKAGDYPSKIAQFFYNDWRMYKKIEVDNNLQQPYILKVGQILNIKLIKQ